MAFCSCNKNDDLDEIFSGRFKITSYRYNDIYDNGKLTELNKTRDNYWVSFSGGTLNGMLTNGVGFNGTWQADPESRDMKVRISDIATYPSELSRYVINILRNATSYSGDHNVLTIKKDNKNYIVLDSGI